ncbi:unnamed protein product [Ectocarpus sp. 12 AP-2014]
MRLLKGHPDVSLPLQNRSQLLCSSRALHCFIQSGRHSIFLELRRKVHGTSCASSINSAGPLVRDDRFGRGSTSLMAAEVSIVPFLSPLLRFGVKMYNYTRFLLPNFSLASPYRTYFDSI